MWNEREGDGRVKRYVRMSPAWSMSFPVLVYIRIGIDTRTDFTVAKGRRGEF